MKEKRKYSGFFDYFSHTCEKMGEVAQEVSNDMYVCRQWPWAQTYRLLGFYDGRRRALSILAHRWREPLGKLLFLVGLNPWADRLEWSEQAALWEFIERMVQEKEAGRAKLRGTSRLAKEFFKVETDGRQTETDETIVGDSQ